MTVTTLELAIASSQIDATRSLTERLGGRCYIDDRPNAKNLPFRALALVTTDDLTGLLEIADVGLYIVATRTIKAGTAGSYGVFPLLKHPDKTHQQADAHWRDVHAPLALHHHAHMTHYVQLSIIKILDGLAIDGIALCGFSNSDDLRNRFFSEPDGVEVISADIKNFADTSRSPRRLVARVEQFSI